MNIIEITKQFSTQKKCIKFLEKQRWNNNPVCPYCGCKTSTPKKDEFRYQCCNHECNKAYSVTVGTIFHHTHLLLPKWFLAMAMICNAKKGISSMDLARDLKINQKTAWRIGMQIREAMADKDFGELMTGIVECDEIYIGGKPKKGDRKKDDDDNFLNTGGRDTKKQAVIGVVQSDGKVKAQKQNKFDFNAINEFLSKPWILNRQLYTQMILEAIHRLVRL